VTAPVARPPLAGMRVLVPRRTDGPDPLVIAAAAAGAEPVVVELIATVPPEDLTGLDDRLRALGSGYYAWLVLTSAAAVPVLLDRAGILGTDLATLTSRTRVAGVGPATARALRAAGAQVTHTPNGASSAAALLSTWPAAGPDGGRILLPHGDLAAATLADGLRARGWQVDEVVAYRTVPGPPPDARTAAAYAAGDLGAVLLTSGSTARNLVDLLGPPPATTVVCCIGESTAEVARRVGLRVGAVATEQTPAGLVAALVGATRSGPTTSPESPPSLPSAGDPHDL
jgi:uroporphyrinogen-III synthase